MRGWRTLSAGLASSISHAYSKVKDAFQSKAGTTGKELTPIDVAGHLRFNISQFIAGFKTAVTYPFNIIRMPLYPNSRRLLGHITLYNLLYYLLPIIAYQGVVRDAVKILSGLPEGTAMFLVDLMAQGFFLRAAANAYTINVANQLNASTIKIPSLDDLEELPKCGCPDSTHLKSSLMSPIYYIGKIITCAGLSKIPGLGYLTDFALRPLAVGECVVEVKLDGLCSNHRAEYYASHNSSSLGMGIAVVISTKLLALLFERYTGAKGAWLEDALLNLLLPLIVFHVNNSRLSGIHSPAISIDTFYPLRETINQIFKRLSSFMIPRLMMANKTEGIFPYLSGLVSSKPITVIRNLLLYPSLNQPPKPLVEVGPINMFFKQSESAIAAKIKTFRLVLDNEAAVRGCLVAAEFLPFVPPVDHINFVVELLTKDKKFSAELLEKLESIIRHAKEFNSPTYQPARVRWYDNSGKKTADKKVAEETWLKLKEDYFQAGSQEEVMDDIIKTFHHTPPATEPTAAEDKMLEDFNIISYPSIQTDNAISSSPQEKPSPKGWASMLPSFSSIRSGLSCTSSSFSDDRKGASSAKEKPKVI